MEDEQQKIKDNLEQNFKGKEYLDEMRETWEVDPEDLPFMLKFIHGIVCSGKFKGNKLLEIGCGATVHNIASASAFYSHISMSDYVQDTLDCLKKWIDGDTGFDQFLDIPVELEGLGNDMESGRKILEDRIRKCIKRVVRSDILTDNVLLERSSDPMTSPPYDLVIVCLTFEVAPVDIKTYKASVKNVSKLLRPGGGIIMCGFCGASSFGIRGKMFHHLYIGLDDIQAALTDAGFGKLDIQTQEGKTIDLYEGFTYDKLYCIAAEKL